MQPAPIRYARNGDVSIAYTTMGDGPIDLIFVGGFVSHLEIGFELPQARRFYERLASFCRVVFFDKRGLGLSDRGAGSYTVEAVAEDMIAVLDAVGMERPAVFGVSEGGSAATLFAATYPERTSALVEYGSYARASAADDYPEGLPSERIHAMVQGMHDHWAEPDFLGLFAPSWAGDSQAEQWWARMIRSGTSPSGLKGMEEMYQVMDVRPLLPLVRVPALILWRVEDLIVPPALSSGMAEAIPDARGIEMPGSDHLFLAGDQEALLGEVEEFLTGKRTSAVPERALATILFTDIVGSTEQAASLGDSRWRGLLSEHDRLARVAVEGERGQLVKSTGDGVLASFDGPARAIESARRLRDRVEPLGLRIRAGIHTGECERIGDDLGGIAVHIGARVSSAAGAGEVLVSQTVRDLVVGSGIEFEERGSRELKGVPGSWQLFAVKGD